MFTSPSTKRLLKSLPDKARAVDLVRNRPEIVFNNKLEIYRQVIAEGAGC